MKTLLLIVFVLAIFSLLISFADFGIIAGFIEGTSSATVMFSELLPTVSIAWSILKENTVLYLLIVGLFVFAVFNIIIGLFGGD